MDVLMLVVNELSRDARVLREARALCEAGSSVLVIGLREDKPDWRPEGQWAANLSTMQLPLSKYRGDSIYSYTWYYCRFFVFCAIFLIREQIRPQVAVAHSMPELIVLCLWPLKWSSAKTKIVLDVHDLTPELFATKFEGARIQRAVNAITGISMRAPDHIVTVSDAYGALIEEKYNRESLVVANFPDDNVWAPREPLPWGAGRCQFVFHGTVSHRNGVLDLIEAFALVKDGLPLVRLRFLGDGDAVADLQMAVARLGLGDAVEVTGSYVPLESLPRHLSDCHVGVSPLQLDSFTTNALPTKALEYLSHGMPLVASRVPELSKLVPEHCALFFEPNSVEDLAAKLCQAATDATAAIERAARGLALDLNWSNEAWKLQAMIQEMLT